MVAGCADLLGIDGGERRPSGAGGTTTAQSTSASGGGAAGASATGGGGAIPTSASDWRNAFHALYLFDELDLGVDSSPADNHLSLLEPFPVRDTQEKVQGASAMHITAQGQRAISDAPEFTQTASGITFGAWVRFDDQIEPAATPLGRHTPANPFTGFLLYRVLNTAVFCQVADQSMAYPGVVALMLPLDEWAHVVCRFDPAGGALGAVAAFANGLFAGSQAAMLDVGNNSFGMPPNDSEFLGRVDEAFFIAGLLSNDEIERIHACGIDGTLCTCESGAPSSYTFCGRVHPNCSTLLDCDASAPDGVL
jgi:hypothetical protein